MSTGADSLIRAALLWDAPTLLRSEDPGAEAFIDALGPGRPHGNRGDAPAKSALEIGASAIRAERSGSELPDEVLMLCASSELDVKVLGHMLLWWSSSSLAPEIRRETARLLDQLEPPEFRARMFASLAVHAYDRGEQETFASAMQNALASASAETALWLALKSVALNYGLESRLTTDMMVRAAPDRMVDLDWIDDTALMGARGHIEDALLSRARSPWNWSFRSGPGPLDRAVAAELQAGWAGALWKRSATRKQAGAQALLAAGERPENAEYGIAMWILGGGREIANAVRLAEQSFSEVSADVVASVLMVGSDWDRRRRAAVTEFAAAAWDLLSETLYERLLDIVVFPEGVPSDPGLTVWAQGAVRLSDSWVRRISDAPASDQVSVLGALSPYALTEVDPELAPALLEAFGVIEREISADEEAAHIALGARVTGQRWASETREGVVGKVLERNPDALSDNLLRSVEQRIARAFLDEVEQAKAGVAGIGGRSRPFVLSQIAKARGRASPDVRRMLIQVAGDPDVPADHRLNALDGLARLAVGGFLTTSDFRRLGARPQTPRRSIFLEVSEALLTSAWLLARAPVLRDEDLRELGRLIRDSDSRVRELSANAAAVSNGARATGEAQEVLLAALFDPDERVVRSALGGIGRGDSWAASRHGALGGRVLAIFENYGRLSRARAVAAARAWGEPPNFALDRLLEAAVADRSWLVRSEVLSP